MRRFKLKYAYIALLIVAIIHSITPVFVIADSVTSSVTVGNTSPTFTAGPAENPASDATTPTNAGSNVTFQATGTDTNNENYYLAICKTNSVTPVNGNAPTCGGGNWCISTSTSSAAQASCSYTTLTGDAESNVWFAFVCDNNASAAACSSSSQGSGSSGSPFKVNHVPAFTAIGNDGPKNPGTSVTWTATASDGDTDGTADTVKLVVCKTTGLAAGDCDGGAGDRWCTGSLAASSPTCVYAVPTPTADGANNAFAYVVDNHNFGATSGTQGSASNFTVSNVAPVVSAVTLNGGSDISLTENSTTNVVVGATVTDNNSCQDLSAVETSVYRSAITYATCDTNPEDNNNNCYAVVTCSVVGAGNTCTGASDSSADYTCTVAIQYHADPTDTATIYTAQNWLTTVKASDEATSGSTEISSGVEVLSLVGYDVTASINYGNLSAGQSNDPLDKTTTITNTGNVGLDEELSGTNMTSGGNTIPVGNQKYALAASTAYASGTALSTTPTEVELNCQKTTTTVSPITKDTYWGILIPSVPSGSYSGTVTVTGVKGETAGW